MQMMAISITLFVVSIAALLSAVNQIRISRLLGDILDDDGDCGNEQSEDSANALEPCVEEDATV